MDLRSHAYLLYISRQEEIREETLIVKISTAEDHPMVSVSALSAMTDNDSSTSSSNEGVKVISDDKEEEG